MFVMEEHGRCRHLFFSGTAVSEKTTADHIFQEKEGKYDPLTRGLREQDAGGGLLVSLSY